MKAQLVVVDEFHYSKKGKEINHYKLANKYIIIAPKETTGIKEALKKILPVGLILVIGAAIIEFFNFFMMGSGTIGDSASFTNVAMDMAVESVPMVAEGARAATEVATKAVSMPSIWAHFSIWFLIGGIAVLLVYLFFEIIRSKISKK